MLVDTLTAVVVPAVLWSLIALSVITWALLVIKLIEFNRARRLDKRFQKDFWAAKSLEKGESIAQQAAGPMADIAKSGFAVVTGRDILPTNQTLAHKINRGDRLERTLRQQIQRKRQSMESGIAILASFGSTAPFIGLFGTVWGVMNALISIDQSGSNGLQAVAGPVGHALIATGLGIAVAVPAVLIYNYLLRRLKVNIHSLSDFSFHFYSLFQQSDFEADYANPQQEQRADPTPAFE